MDAEQQIQETLKQNIPAPAAHTVAEPVIGEDKLTSQPDVYPLDELTEYKLSRHLGEARKGDTEAKNQLAYIFKDVSDRIGTTDYTAVIAKIHEIKRIIGISHDDNQRYKLYQWLKLDQKRTKIEQDMQNVRWSL